MYPHPQLSHPSLTSNMPTKLYSSQQFYASNPFLYSFPQPILTSDSHAELHPPGTDPHANSASSLSSTPATFQPTVGSSHETLVGCTSLPSVGNGTWPHQYFVTDNTVVLPNQTKVTKSMRCEVCKIDCNSKDVYEKHIKGKKHLRKLQVQTNPTNTEVSPISHARTVQSQTSSIQGGLSGGQATDSEKVCTICNIVCNSQVVFDKHLAGKKHAAQVRLKSNNGFGPHLAAFKRHGIGYKEAPKKIKVSQLEWCAICKINCNSKDVYTTHLAGKKHLKNLEKLSKSQNYADAGATAAMATANTLQNTTKPVIGLQEKPDGDKPESRKSPEKDIESKKPEVVKGEADGTAAICKANTLQHTRNPIIGSQEKLDADKPKSRKAPKRDIEAKKRKIVEGGADVAAVRLCTLCNVVCNSQAVFDKHLVGHKHAAMLKKQAESRGAATG